VDAEQHHLLAIAEKFELFLGAGRRDQIASNAKRQQAYRQRKAQEQEELKRALNITHRRRLVSAKLVKVLGMLGSDYEGERDTAARMATQILKEAGLTWYDVLGVEEDFLK
jgi:hypothetical protein